MEQEAFTKWKECKARRQRAGRGPGPLLLASPSSQPCAWGAWEREGSGPASLILAGRQPAEGDSLHCPRHCAVHQLGGLRAWLQAALLHRALGVPAGEAPGSLRRLCKQEIHKQLRSPFRERSRTGHSSPFTHCSANPKYHPRDGMAATATLPQRTCPVPLQGGSWRCEDMVGLHMSGWGCKAGRSQHQTATRDGDTPRERRGDAWSGMPFQ